MLLIDIKILQNHAKKLWILNTLPNGVRFDFAKRNIADSFFTKEPAMFYFLCIHIGVDGILFNKLTTRTYVITHQHREYVVGVGSIFE